MFDNFDDNFGIKNDFTKYLKERLYWQSAEQHFSFKYFLNFTFAYKI